MANQNMREQLALSLSNDVLTGALVQKKKAGYQFGFHIHTTIEIYRIVSGSCHMDIASESIHCKAGDFIMILPNVIHSFRVDYSGDCEYQQIHFRPDTFTKIILSDDGIYPIGMMHAIRFHCQTYYRQESDQVLDDCVNKIISLHSSTDSLFTAANINIAIMNIMLHILDKKRPNHDFTDPNLQNSYSGLHPQKLYAQDSSGGHRKGTSDFRPLSEQPVQKIYDDHTVQLYQYLPHQQIH